MRYHIINEEKRGSTLASMIPMISKVETKPGRHVSLSQHHYQETTGETNVLLKGFLLSLKVSITWIVRTPLYRKTFYPRL